MGNLLDVPPGDARKKVIKYGHVSSAYLTYSNMVGVRKTYFKKETTGIT